MDREHDVLSRLDMKRLHHLRLQGKMMRERMEAMSSECCELLSVLDDGSDEADLARSIIEHDADPERVALELYPV